MGMRGPSARILVSGCTARSVPYAATAVVAGGFSMTQAKVLAILLAVLVPASGAVVAFTAPGITTPPELAGRVAYVGTGSITTMATPSGVVQDYTQLSLNFGATGIVNQVLVKPGQKVKAGQLLASILDPTLQNQVESDQA